MQAAFGCLAFWLDRSDGLFELWMAVWALLSGYVAPLAFFPEAVRPMLSLLPFRAMLGLPVEVLCGLVDPSAAVRELAIAWAWVAAASVLVSVLWRRGLVR